jgi:hypothetical protein
MRVRVALLAYLLRIECVSVLAAHDCNLQGGVWDAAPPPTLESIEFALVRWTSPEACASVLQGLVDVARGER